MINKSDNSFAVTRTSPVIPNSPNRCGESKSREIDTGLDLLIKLSNPTTTTPSPGLPPIVTLKSPTLGLSQNSPDKLNCSLII